MKKLMLMSVFIAVAFAANAQTTTSAPDVKSPAAKESSQQTVKKEDPKATETAAKERADLKEKAEDLRVARLKESHLKVSVSKDKEDLKKLKAEVDQLEAKISKREKDLAALSDRIKDDESTIAKLQSQANSNKKTTTTEAKASKKISD
jgi:hypothetical protein